MKSNAIQFYSISHTLAVPFMCRYAVHRMHELVATEH